MGCWGNLGVKVENICEVFDEHLIDIHWGEGCGGWRVKGGLGCDFESSECICIREDEVLETLERMRVDKAPGQDASCGRMLRQATEEI